MIGQLIFSNFNILTSLHSFTAVLVGNKQDLS